MGFSFCGSVVFSPFLDKKLREDLGEDGMDVHVGIVVVLVGILGVVAQLGMVEGRLHEFRKGDRPLLLDLFRDDIFNLQCVLPTTNNIKKRKKDLNDLISFL